MIQDLNKNAYRTVLIPYAGHSRNGITRILAEALGVETKGRGIPLTARPQQHIEAMIDGANSRHPVITVDDAHRLENDSLWDLCSLLFQTNKPYGKMFDTLDMKDHVWDDKSNQSLVKDSAISDFDMTRFVYGSPDSASLLISLYHLRIQIKVLVGHSKGNYVIENALEGLVSLCTFKKQDIPKDFRFDGL